MVELDAKLPALLSGEYEPTSSLEMLRFATLCFNFKRLNIAAARLCERAWTMDPQWVGSPGSTRYFAVRAGLRAAQGLGDDAGALDETEKSRWREQAQKWFVAELILVENMPYDRTRGEPDQRPRILQEWQKERDLASVRDAAALAKLPTEERKAWQEIWERVDRCLTAVKTTDESKEPPMP
jgi:hypothetical protein